LRKSKGEIALNHPDLNRKFEGFAYEAMSLPEGEKRNAVIEAAGEFQRKCSDKLFDLIHTEIDGVHIFKPELA